jgi:formate hydrogenlyase subunit 6/NADH:ubiquinone oxidoreductase subunit I
MGVGGCFNLCPAEAIEMLKWNPKKERKKKKKKKKRRSRSPKAKF